LRKELLEKEKENEARQKIKFVHSFIAEFVKRLKWSISCIH